MRVFLIKRRYGRHIDSRIKAKGDVYGKKNKNNLHAGPSPVDDDQIMREMMLSGMDCARLNFSHGPHPEQLERIERVKRIRQELKLPIPIMLDTKGPEIRLGNFENGKAELEPGDQIILCADSSILGNKAKAPLSYPRLGAKRTHRK